METCRSTQLSVLTYFAVFQIHKSCFDQLVRSGHFCCPVCARSLVDMREMWAIYDQQISETPLPQSYQVKKNDTLRFPTCWYQIMSLFQNLYAFAHCRDCLRTSRCRFHVLGIKCAGCGGYNTVREKGPLLRKQTDDTCE